MPMPGTRKRTQTVFYTAAPTSTHKAKTYSVKKRSANQLLADLMRSIKGGVTKTDELRKKLASIEKKKALSAEKHAEIEAMINERARLMSQKGYLKHLEKQARNAAEREALAAQQAQHAAQEATLAAQVGELEKLLGEFGF